MQYFYRYALIVLMVDAGFGLHLVKADADDPALILKALEGRAVSPDWSPLFLKLIQLIGGESAFSYSTLFLVASIPLALIFYALAYRLGRDHRRAFWLSIAILFSPVSPAFASLLTPPSSIAIYPGLFLFLLGTIQLTSDKPMIRHLYPITFALASLFRPEFLLVALLAVFFYTTELPGIQQAFRINASVVFPVINLFLLYGLFNKFGLPVPNATRQTLAFSQHFSLRFCETNVVFCRDLNPWLDWQQITDYAFPSEATLLQKIQSNFSGFLNHVSINAFQALLGIFSFGYSFALMFNAMGLIRIAGALCSVIAIYLLFKRLFSSRFAFQASRVNVFLGLSTLPFLLSEMLLYPRIHYAVLPVYVFALLFWSAKTEKGG